MKGIYIPTGAFVKGHPATGTGSGRTCNDVG